MTTTMQLFLAIASVFSLCDFVGAGCPYPKKCCRQKIDYGTCQSHVRRYAYNISCGKCVPFDYSGCGGDQNVFHSLQECSGCCKGTSPCPYYSLPPPPSYCQYKYHDGQDGCPRPRLDCSCRPQYCSPNTCNPGQQCVPYPITKPCKTCPCQQYQCIKDPCYKVPSSPCEKCIPVPAPSCPQQPCPLVPYRKNYCSPSYPQQPQYPQPQYPQPQYPEPQYPQPQYPEPQYPEPQYPQPQPPSCPIHVECPPQGNPCQYQSCPAYPKAQCQVDPCDCRKYSFQEYGQAYSPAQCSPPSLY